MCLHRAALDTCHKQLMVGRCCLLIWLLSVSSGFASPPLLNSLPRGNHFAAVMALLINHHKLRPQLYSCVERFSCVLWRWNPGLSGLPRSEPHSHPSMINGLLGYTNTLIIHVWKNTDRMTNICVNWCMLIYIYVCVCVRVYTVYVCQWRKRH